MTSYCLVRKFRFAYELITLTNFQHSPLFIDFTGLASKLKFVGSLHSVYYNQHNVLREMYDNSDAVHHHGIFPIEYGETDVIDVPLTFSFASAKLNIPYDFNRTYKFSLDFKPDKPGVLVSSAVSPDQKSLYWEVSALSFSVQFRISWCVLINTVRPISAYMLHMFG